MTDEQADVFYRSAMPLGTTLQVDEDQWPKSRKDFEDYWNTACARIEMDYYIREFLLKIVDLKMINTVSRIVLAPLLRFLTIGFLAPVFRDNLGVEWTPTSAASSTCSCSSPSSTGSSRGSCGRTTTPCSCRTCGGGSSTASR